MNNDEEESILTDKLIYGDKVSFATSLSTFYNLRGFSGRDYDTLFFDEFIPEALERTRFGEGDAFLNAIETINRNRELKGSKPLTLLLAGNTNTLTSSILNAFGLIEVTQKMMQNHQEVYVNKDTSIAIFNLENSPISQRKKDTWLYKVAASESFKGMALENKFNDLEKLKDRLGWKPLNEYTPLYSLSNKVWIYKHKNDNTLYVSNKKSGNVPNFDLSIKDDKIKFNNLFRDRLYDAIIDSKIYYQNFAVKVSLSDAL